MYNIYNKLVRDEIPRIIKENGKNPEVRILSEQDYLKALDKKLTEEVAEYQADKSMEEIADILEVLDAICLARGYSIEDVLKVKTKKLQSRGGFSKRVYLVGVEDQ